MDRTRNERAAALGYLLLLALVLACARGGLFPGTGEVFDGALLEHPYRLSMAIVAAVLAVLLGMGAGWMGAGRRSPVRGLGVLIVGGFVTGLVLSFAPYVLFPGDQYPVSFGWLVAGAPLAGITWLIATYGFGRRAAAPA